MIKLVITDMDGTLLSSQKEISDKTYQYIEELQKKGVLFCVASGRALHNVISSYHGNQKDVIFVGDNGANILIPGKNILTTVPKEVIHASLKIAKENGFWISMNSDHYTYVEKDCDEAYLELLKHYGVTIRLMEDLKEVEDKIVKITVCDKRGSQKYLYPAFECLKTKSNVVVSGDIWLDICNKTVNKGFALKKIMEHYDIDFDEVVAFGDYNNDIRLLKNAKYGIAVYNAVDELKKYAYKVSDRTNDQEAVYYELKALFQKVK